MIEFIYKSDVTTDFNKDFAKFQQAMYEDRNAVIELSKGNFNDYAGILELRRLVVPFLYSNGFVIDQCKTSSNGHIYMMTVITHIATDQFKRSYDYLFPEGMFIEQGNNVKNAGNIQQIKGCIETYVCRRALTHMLCLPLYEKDFESKDIDKQLNYKEIPEPKNITLNSEQIKELGHLAGGNKDSLKRLLDYLGAKSGSEIKLEDYDRAIEFLNTLKVKE